MDRLYPSNAGDAYRIRAMILYGDVMMTALMTGHNPMEDMWNREQ